MPGARRHRFGFRLRARTSRTAAAKRRWRQAESRRARLSIRAACPAIERIAAQDIMRRNVGALSDRLIPGRVLAFRESIDQPQVHIIILRKERTGIDPGIGNWMSRIRPTVYAGMKNYEMGILKGADFHSSGFAPPGVDLAVVSSVPRSGGLSIVRMTNPRKKISGRFRTRRGAQERY